MIINSAKNIYSLDLEFYPPNFKPIISDCASSQTKYDKKINIISPIVFNKASK